MADAPKLPTIEELRDAFEKGLPQTLLSGVEVAMRPLRPEPLLFGGKIPDPLRPILMHMLFPPRQENYSFPDELDAFVSEEREDEQAQLDFVQSVDTVCDAVLIDPSIRPFLTFADRLWIFRLAFYPVEVLSRFRLQPPGDVGVVVGEQGAQPTEPDAAGDGTANEAEPVHALPV
jgi:hypothetical protein